MQVLVSWGGISEQPILAEKSYTSSWSRRCSSLPKYYSSAGWHQEFEGKSIGIGDIRPSRLTPFVRERESDVNKLRYSWWSI